MKLYGTIKSERAEKGQGGNEFLEIEITDDKRQVLAKMKVEPGGDKNRLIININDTLCVLDQQKSTSCECTDSMCAKCLLKNCQDSECEVHPESKKREFREMYNNR
jgi:hypothetical protein